MNLIFFGTSAFAVPALEALLGASFHIELVVTLPDKKGGRGLPLISSPVKHYAEKNGLSVFQPENLTDATTIKRLSSLRWDIGIVAAYGKIIPKTLLDIPLQGLVNIHPSLLPELRGPSPIQWAILKGEKETGVTIMKMAEKMDHGPILAQKKIAIAPSDTAESLGTKLSRAGAELLISVIPQWTRGALHPKPQNETNATFSKIIKKEDGYIQWNEPIGLIERKIRAFTPWPGAYGFFFHNAKKIRLKILEAELGAISPSSPSKPGVVVKSGNDMIVEGCGGALRIIKIQPEGKKVLSGKEFLNGYGFLIGTTLC